MPVYDYNYKTWEGERRGPLFRWLTIPKFTYIEFFSKRIFIWLFTLAWLQFFFRLGYLYLLVNLEFLSAMKIPLQTLPAINATFFKTLIDGQLIFCFLFSFHMGAGLISRDLKHSAAVLFMSKPISKWEYFLGKFSTLFSLLMLLTWFQGMFLFAIQTIIAPEHSHWALNFRGDYSWLAWSITAYSFVVSATLSLIILAASSLTKNSRYAGTAFAIYIIGTSVVSAVLAQILHSTKVLAISPFYAGTALGFHCFRLEETAIIEPIYAWLGIIGNCLLCGLVLKWRVTRVARYGR